MSLNQSSNQVFNQTSSQVFNQTFSKTTKQKYPFVNRYIDNLQNKGITNEGLHDEINSLNECALCDVPYTTSQRLGVAFLSSLNPTTILGGAIGYIMSGDQCPTKYREAEERYMDFSSKL